MEPDEDYVYKINALIPHATSEANRIVAEKRLGGERRVGVDGNIYIFDWQTYFFHKAINEMAFKAGLRTWR